MEWGSINMYVCICNQVTDKAIKDEIAAGAKSFAEVQKALNVATCCGTCKEMACSFFTSVDNANTLAPPSTQSMIEEMPTATKTSALIIDLTAHSAQTHDLTSGYTHTDSLQKRQSQEDQYQENYS